MSCLESCAISTTKPRICCLVCSIKCGSTDCSVLMRKPVWPELGRHELKEEETVSSERPEHIRVAAINTSVQNLGTLKPSSRLLLRRSFLLVGEIATACSLPLLRSASLFG